MEASTAGWKLQRALLAASASTSGNPSDGFVYNFSGTDIPNVVQGTTVYISVGAQNVGTVTATDVFSFCQYGKYILLGRYDTTTGNVRNMQIRDGSNNTDTFADSSATAIPKAAICVTWGPPTSPRVMLLNYDDGTHYNDGWWTSHQGGPTAAWTVDVATGAANGRLIGANTIRCGIAYRDDIIVFADQQMWKGVFVGPPYVVEWQRITDDVGAAGPGSAKVINGILYFVGEKGLFQYDGTYPRKMAVPIQQQIMRVMGGFAPFRMRTKIASDGTGQRMLVSIRDTTVAAATRVYLIDLLNNKVGVDGRGSWLVLDNKWFVSPSGGIQQESINAAGGDPYQPALSDLFGIGLHYMGSNVGDSKLESVIPRFITAPTTYSANDYYGPTQSEILASNTGATTVSATPWRCNFLRSARWHAPRLLFSSSGADMEIADVAVNLVPGGTA